MSFDHAVENALIAARHNLALIRQWAGGSDFDTLRNDVMCRYAIQYAFIVLNEAIADIPASYRTAHAPEGMWRDIRGMRNLLAHTYDDTMIDNRVILTIRNDLPALDKILEHMLHALQKTS